MRYRITALLAALVLLTFPRSAVSQHMYLDTDGDGLSTPSDVVAPSGPTTLSVWLRTDANKDGSPASCATADLALTLSAYQFILHARNGTVAWSGFVNHLAGYGGNLGSGSSATDYYNGLGGGTLAPGLYRLASVTVDVTAGSPSIEIAASTPLEASALTSFASLCPGNDFDNTLKLGIDWFDTDGAAFGGVQNRAPVLAQPADMTVAEGAVLEQSLTATDPEGDPISFSLGGGPPFASVATTEPGSGTGHGVLRLSPGAQTAGTYVVTVEAMDHFVSDRKDLTVTVLHINTAPVMAPIADQTLREGTALDVTIGASDAQGDPLTFSIASGPYYASLRPGPLPTLRFLHLEPGYADAGDAIVMLSVTDGYLIDQTSARVSVLEAYPTHNEILCAVADLVVPSGGTAERALHGISPDGQPVQFTKLSGPDFLAVETLSPSPSGAVGRIVVTPGPQIVGSFSATVAATDGIATAPQTFTIAVGPPDALPSPDHPLFKTGSAAAEIPWVPQSLAVADLDGDGILDAVTANLDNFTVGNVVTLRGRGDGTFERRQDYPLVHQPYSVAVGDLNEDGRPDLAVVDSSLHVLSVIQAIGGCQFGRRLDFRTGSRPAHVALGDWNGDGHLDASVSNEGAGTISILMGRGDGTFGPPTDYQVGEDPCYSSAGDFNHDGKPDLAVANEESNNVSVLLGNGDGTFGAQSQYSCGVDPRAVEIGDFNEDGNLDLATSNFDGTVSILTGNSTGLFPTRSDFPVGLAPWSIALADWDGDGHLDLATANVSENGVAVLFGNGAGSLGPRTLYGTGYLSRFVRPGDLDGDGRLDLIVANEGAGTVTSLLGRGDRGFGFPDRTPLESVLPENLLAGDWNGDGVMDLLTLNYRLQSVLGTGDGRFVEGPGAYLTSTYFTLNAADWNGDGVLDLAVLDHDGAAVTLDGVGDGSFTGERRYPLAGSPFAAATGDLNADGRADLVVVAAVPSAIHVFEGQGDGSLAPRAPFPLPGAVSIAVGDLNGDGRADLAVGTAQPNAVQILTSNGSGGLDAGPVLPLPQSPSSVLMADLQGDGTPDLVVGLPLSGFSFFAEDAFVAVALGTGGGQFASFDAPVRAGRGGVQLRALDANGDGRADLAVATELGTGLRLGLGNGQFQPEVPLATLSIVMDNPTDLTGDGRPDVALSDNQGSAIMLARNLGTFPVAHRPPVVGAPGSAEATPNALLTIQVTASDPDGEPIAALTADLSGLPAVNDASFEVNAAHSAGTLTWTPKSADVGAYDVHFTATNDRTGSASTHIVVAAAVLSARAFLTPDEVPLRLFKSRPEACLRLEPVDGSFALTDVDPASFTLRADSAGTAGGVDAVSGKATPLIDRDGNGVDEVPLCFSRSELAVLLGTVHGLVTVPIALEGVLVSGERVRATLQIQVLGGGNFPRVRTSPNPMNPTATFTIATSRTGPLRLRLFDVSGRLVRVLLDQRDAPGGVRDVPFDGRGTAGSDLASGVYFYRLDSGDGAKGGRIMLLR